MTMPLRKMKQKKYTGIYEYYREKDPDKVTVGYYINYRNADNKPIKEKVDASTPEEAVIILKQKLNQRKTEPNVVMNSMLTLRDYAKKFFENRTTKNNDNDQKKFNKHIKEDLLSKKIQKVDESDLEELQKQLISSLAPKTVNDIVALLLTILNKAFNEKILSVPLRKIIKLEVDNARQRVFSKKELDYLLTTPTTSKVKMFMELAYYTAQRPQSILELQRKDIDVEAGTILIKAIKKSKSHKIPVSVKLSQPLYKWIKDLEPDDYLIHPNDSSKRPLTRKSLYDQTKSLFIPLNKGLDKATDSLNWASMYILRHTALTNLYRKTGDIYLTQKIANHSDVRMTQRYAKASDELKLNALDML